MFVLEVGLFSFRMSFWLLDPVRIRVKIDLFHAYWKLRIKI
jgi:hypothetical protein